MFLIALLVTVASGCDSGLHLRDLASSAPASSYHDTLAQAAAGPFSTFALASGERLVVGGLQLVMQTQGNLVLYQGNKALWATNWLLGNSLPAGSSTNNGGLDTCTTCSAFFQADGNLVLYKDGVPYWASNTEGNAGALLSISDQAPYLSIKNATGATLFAQIPSNLNFNLQAGQSMTRGDLTLVMQVQGNLVLYRGNTAVWATNLLPGNNLSTASSNYDGGLTNCVTCSAFFQTDGNLVLYNAGIPYWASNTGGNAGAALVISDQAPYVAIASSSGPPLFAQIPSSVGFNLQAGESMLLGNLKLTMQGDGNLVLYQGNTALWNSATFGQVCAANACQAVLQSDGNLVVYNGSTALWNSQTGGHPEALLNITASAPFLSISYNVGVLNPGSANAPNILTCAIPGINNPQIDSTAALTKCLAQPVGVIQLAAGNYYIDSTLNMPAHSNFTLQTVGVANGPACLAPGAAACAVIMASATNPGPVLFTSWGNTNVTFNYVALDGNIRQRRALFSNSQWDKSLTPNGSAWNARIHGCTSCRFLGFASVRAVNGTALEFDGDNAVFNNTLFRDNGWGYLNAPPTNGIGSWSDGLSIWSSNNLQVLNSTFMDNSDVDFIMGNAQNAVIENNVIGNTHNFAYAALMLDNFNGGFPGNFSGTVIANNQINCGNGMCGLGIDVGPHMWYDSPNVIGGTIYGNSVVGARQGIITNGATGTNIYGNSVGVFGNYVSGNCVTDQIAWSTGDSVNIHDNNIAPTLSRLAGCGPTLLPVALSNFAGTSVSVAQAYRDVLGRDPDSGGGPNYTSAVNNGMSIVTMRTQLAQSPEGQAVLNSLYLAVLNRNIDPSGAQTWTNYLINGGTVAQLFSILQTTPEGQLY